jgi:hypothetical protein
LYARVSSRNNEKFGELCGNTFIGGDLWMKVTRYIWILMLFLLILPQPIQAAERPAPIHVYLDGALLTFTDAQPYMENGTTYVPFRPIFEAMGLSVAWDSTRKTITGTQEGLTIQLTLNQTAAAINGVSKTMEAPPKLIQGSSFIPLRFVAEATGKQVSWDGETRTIRIQTPSAEQSLKQLLEPLNIPELGSLEVYQGSDSEPATVAFHLNTPYFTSMSNSNELRLAVAKLMRQIQEVPHYIFTPSTISQFRLLVLWGAHPIYDWDYTKSDRIDDPGVYDADSDMRVSIHRDRGIVLQYKVRGVWDELPVLGAARLTPNELGVLQLHRNYYEALNAADADRYLALLHEDLKSPLIMEQARGDIRALTSTFQPVALQVLESDPRSNTMIVRSVEHIYSKDMGDITERATYMLLSQGFDGSWRIESMKTDTIEYLSVIQRLGSYHIAKNAPYHVKYPQSTLSEIVRTEISTVISAQLAKQPEISFSWGPEDIHYLREEAGILYVAVQLFHGVESDPASDQAADPSYTRDVVYAMKRNAQGQWAVQDTFTTKLNYSFQWLSWTME